MNGLALHCGASLATRDEVYNVVTPDPTGSHFPIPHANLLEVVEANCKLNDMVVVEEAHALTKEGMRFFSLLRIEPTDGKKSIVIGVRNTHDKAWSAAIAIGSFVFVCDNLAFSGQIVVGRKHTRHIERDLPLLVPRAFAALSHEVVAMEERTKAYEETEISDERAHDLIVRSLVDEKIFPVSRLKDVVHEWREPKHEEFAPRNVWSLANAYTEIAKVPADKPAALNTLCGRTRDLYGFLDKSLGLNFREVTQQDALNADLADAGIGDTVVRNDAYDLN